MLNLNTFALADIDDVLEIKKSWNAGIELDPADFSINGYPVDSDIYPLVGVAEKGKGIAHDKDEDTIGGAGDDDEDEGFTGTEEIDSSAEEYPGEPSNTAAGLAAAEESPLRSRQLDFETLAIEGREDTGRPSQESHTATGRGRGRGGRGGQKRKSVAVAKESPKTRFRAEAAEQINRLAQQIADGERERRRMAEEFRIRDEERHRQHTEMMQMFSIFRTSGNLGIPAVPLQTAMPRLITQGADAGVAHVGDNELPCPVLALSPPTATNEPQAESTLPQSADVNAVGVDQEQSSGPSQT